MFEVSIVQQAPSSELAYVIPFFSAFLLTAPVNFVYAAEGQKSAGLPQMDIATFPSQLFWLVITFSLLYLFMWKFVIPRLGATIEERRDKISNDINDADNLNTEATDILKKYDEQMASASQESNEIITNSKKAMLDHLETLKKENEEKVNSLISESQAKIKAQEEKSKIEIRNATLDTVKAIVSRYIENIPSDDEINKKLN